MRGIFEITFNLLEIVPAEFQKILLEDELIEKIVVSFLFYFKLNYFQHPQNNLYHKEFLLFIKCFTMKSVKEKFIRRLFKDCKFIEKLIESCASHEFSYKYELNKF